MTSAPTTAPKVPQRDGDRQSAPPPIQPPSLPKGGGAISGIGEKFAANPVTGSGSLQVPLATSKGRDGFGPALSLSYDSGAGNGLFGFGWSLSLAAVTRKTDKGMPRYLDQPGVDDLETVDTFVLSGAEDLVPKLMLDAAGEVLRDAAGRPRLDEVEIDGYTVRRYRPRTEGLFARIERWTAIDGGDVHWRSISKENILTIYGGTSESRIADPADPRRIFSWLICETRDDRGNAAVYSYKQEDGTGVDLEQSNERNRGPRDGLKRGANRHPKRIRYGNRVPLLDASGRRPHLIPKATFDAADWMFEVVFDYGEHDRDLPDPDDDPDASNSVAWPVRNDPFSRYRAGFEVRTYRLCRRVLMFHHFPGEQGIGSDTLVRSTEFTYRSDRGVAADATIGNPIGSFIETVRQSGHRRDGANSYRKRSLPPLELEYSRAEIDDRVREIDSESLENLPVGVDGTSYRWVDLDGIGAQGVLSEHAGAWYFKPSLGDGKLGPVRVVRQQPSTATLGDGGQLLDLDGDGRLELVQLRAPVAGFYEHDGDDGWEQFRPFHSLPNIDFADPDLRFLDLSGDGMADAIVAEGDAVSWHAALGHEGFGSVQTMPQPLGEEQGPRLVFVNSEQSVYLADMSGDGLTDFVRIRNGEIAYWPNLGYGRFGAKVAMDRSPWFDEPDQFDQRRVRVTDIDGSGTTDIIYLGRQEARVYFNETGNSWSAARAIESFPPVDNVAGVATADLLGNGTACLVWSSPLPGAEGRHLRYIDLMGGRKPHLLVRSDNNLGAETLLDYASSTKFYLRDQRDGRPWVTKLPFPVHVVERVETIDHVSRSRFVTRYRYHHGYFDGPEREFRGFGMVEQWDSDEYDVLGAGDTDSADTPTVLTKSWFHTGAYLDGRKLSDHYAGLIDATDRGEFYREPAWADDDDEARKRLLADTTLPTGLSVDEEREACRALKGTALRQEIYALDGSDREAHPYTVSETSYSVTRVQPRDANRYGVFIAHENESLNYNYERDPDDPRTIHKLTLEVDEFANVRRAVEAAYGRRSPDVSLPLQDDRDRQARTLVTYTQTDLTDAVGGDRSHRAPLPADVRTFELTGFAPAAERFSLAEFAENDFAPLDDAELIGYGDPPDTTKEQKRLIEQVRTLYRKNDLSGLGALGELDSMALPGVELKLALTPTILASAFKRTRPGQAAENLLPDANAVLGGTGSDQGGYRRGAALKADGLFPASDVDGNWWIAGNHVFYSPRDADTAAQELVHARGNFFLTQRSRDPFGNVTAATYDHHNLLIVETIDDVGNRVTVGSRSAAGVSSFDGNDYRVLQVRAITDENRNRTEATFDTLGMMVATAVVGKGDSGDSVAALDPDPTDAQLLALAGAGDPRPAAAALLGNATTRIVHDLDGFWRSRAASPQDRLRWTPVVAATIARNTHVGHAANPGGADIQIAFAYSDGFGRHIQDKDPAAPGPVTPAGPKVNPRWIGSGWTVFNKKGKPVRKYEPFFSRTHGFEFAREVGVSPILFYDPLGRVVATLQPDHSYKKTTFGPWGQLAYDANDTVAPDGRETGDPRTDPDVGGFMAGYFNDQDASWKTWHAQRIGGALGADEKDAAQKAAAHTNTPVSVHLDALGREFLSLTDNGLDAAGTRQLHATRSDTDLEGNTRQVRDSVVQNADRAGRIVIRDAFDMLGNRLLHETIDGGRRWTLADATGKPIRAWDEVGRRFRTEYDGLRRPLRTVVRGADPASPNAELVVEQVVHGEAHPQAEQRNLRGEIHMHFDQAGVLVHERYDFKGNLTVAARRLASVYDAPADWTALAAVLPTPGNALDTAAVDAALQPLLEAETFTTRSQYDAENRLILTTAPRSDLPGADRNVTQYVFDAGDRLDQVHVWLDHPNEPVGPLDPVATPPSAVGINRIEYDAMGRRRRVALKNGAVTTYDYDELTSRLRRLYTRRGAAFNEDCQDPPPPSATIAAPAEPPAGVKCGLQQLHYAYDPVGNVTTVRDEAQPTIFFRNKKVDPSASFTYDARYRLIAATGREHLGQIGGAPVAHSHSDAPRVGIDWSGNDGNAMGRYVERYEYDAMGNVLFVRHRGTDPLHAGWQRTYTYAEASMIENGASATKFGNRLTRSTLGLNNPIDEPYLHDVHGNMIHMPQLAAGAGALSPNMHWNHADRLVRTDNGDGSTTHHTYDAAGERVRKVRETAAGVVEDRIYLAGFEVFRRRSAAGVLELERETLHVLDDKRRVALVETRTVATAPDPNDPALLIRYQFGNHLGSSSLELDERAQIVSYEEYSPFGSTTYQAVRSQSETPKRYRYTGMERDEHTGLCLHGARYYAPWLGRWTACDPKEKELIAAGSYTYGHDNPVILSDPGGGNPALSQPLFPDPSGVQIPGMSKESIVPFVYQDFGEQSSVTYNTNFKSLTGTKDYAKIPTQFTIEDKTFRGTGTTNIGIQATGIAHGKELTATVRGEHFKQFSQTYGKPEAFKLDVRHVKTNEMIQKGKAFVSTPIGKHVERAANTVGLTIDKKSVAVTQFTNPWQQLQSDVAGKFRAQTGVEKVLTSAGSAVRSVAGSARSWGGAFRTATLSSFVPGYSEVAAVGGGSVVLGARVIATYGTTQVAAAGTAAATSVTAAASTAFGATS
ncbi:MAG: SpvB/TcaC N-terminal domain-containing protein, partial [Solirubrobacterales bacterium]